ncbi:MAG: hypothetical protein J4G00_04435 [Actinomycetia bacterium]|nr:hypothetical protein [Actinomycetes bacterium]
MISHALGAANLQAFAFLDDYLSRLTINAKQHWRQSVIRALVYQEPEIHIADHEKADMGRIVLTFDDNPTTYLVKPMSWVTKNRAAPEAGVSAMLPIMGCGYHVLVYEAEVTALHVGHYGKVRKRGRDVDQIQGDLVEVWADQENVFDQDDHRDWTVDLGEHQDDEAAGEE